MLCACEFGLAEPREIVVAGAADTEMARMLWRDFVPNRIVLQADSEIAQFQPALAHMHPKNGENAVYICENYTCREPAHNPEDLARLLHWES